VIVSWMPCQCALALAARTRGRGHLVAHCQAQGCPAPVGEFDSAARLRCPCCGQGSVRGQNLNVIHPGQRPGRVLRFLPPGAEKAWSEALFAHSVAAYTAAEMMCLPGHKGLNDRRAARPVAAARHRPGLPMECPGVALGA
jgi:hypothetical protein